MNHKTMFSLIAAILVFSSCNISKNKSNESSKGDGLLCVHFDPCTEYETNLIPDQRVEAGSLINEPTLVTPMENKLNMKVTGWYVEKDYQTKWNFSSDTVSKDMTLYARWAETITINYFLKGSKTPIWTVSNAAKGDPLELHDELCDGYKFLGYFKDEACTIPFDLTQPLEYTTSVYLSRGESMSYNATAIKRRFGIYAAGGSGSIEGNISDVSTGEDGIDFVDVNFGYSTTADPFIRTVNPQIDISHSQKIALKFKNFGDASSIGFYWISKYKNGNYAADINYESEENGLHVPLNSDERNMTNDSPWVTKIVDLSEKTTYGVSGWGNSVTMISLRIQFQYISTNNKDFSNVVRFAEIYGIADDTHVGFNDSQEVKTLLTNDSETDVNAAKDAQTQNLGVIFPKNQEKATTNTSSIFVKTDGLLLYSAYDNSTNKFTFDVSDQHILASEYSYLTLRMRNFSYIQSIDLTVTTISPSTGKDTTNNATIALADRMSQKDDFSINLYGRRNMVGEIKSISLEFYVKGVDNAMLLESITLEENRPFQIPGFNFDDAHFAGFSGNSDVGLSYNNNLKTTTFNVSSSSTLTNHLSYTLENIAYKDISLKYYYFSSGINSVKVILLYSDTSSGVYTFDNFEADSGLQSITLPLTEEGSITDISIEFSGAGQIDVAEIRFSLDPETSCDLSNAKTFNSMLPDWRKPLSYFEDKEATLYNSTEYARYYFGYLFQNNRRDGANICLQGKTKIYVIYQNQKPTCGLYLNIYAVDKRTTQDYMTEKNEGEPIIGNTRPTLSNNMDSSSWKVASIDIPAIYQTENYYVSNIGFGVSYSEDNTVFLRGVVFR